MIDVLYNGSARKIKVATNTNIGEQNMKLLTAFNKYLQYKELHSSNGDYEYTKSHSKVILEYFNSMNICNSNQLNESVVTDYIQYKLNKGNSRNTINKEIGIIKRVLNHNNIVIDEIAKIKHLRHKNISFRTLNEKELNLLLNYTNNYNLNNPRELTNYLVIYLLIYTGVRRTELANIKIEEIDIVNCCIYLNHSKTGKPRLVFFKNKIANAISRYISLKPNREYLLHNFKLNSKLTPENISAFFRYLSKKTKISPLSPHILRHTMATLLVENDAPIASIQRLLGHASSKTTDIYIHMSIKKVKSTFETFFPEI